MSFRLDHPAYLALLLLAVPVVVLGMRRLTTLESVRRWLAIGLRLAVLLLLVLILAGLRTQRTHDDLTVMAVVDQSPSMRVFGSTEPFVGNAVRRKTQRRPGRVACSG